MNVGGWYYRTLIGAVAGAVAVHVIWDLVRPVVPALIAVVAGYGILQLIWWRRDRW